MWLLGQYVLAHVKNNICRNGTAVYRKANIVAKLVTTEEIPPLQNHGEMDLNQIPEFPPRLERKQNLHLEMKTGDKWKGKLCYKQNGKKVTRKFLFQLSIVDSNAFEAKSDIIEYGSLIGNLQREDVIGISMRATCGPSEELDMISALCMVDRNHSRFYGKFTATKFILHSTAPFKLVEGMFKAKYVSTGPYLLAGYPTYPSPLASNM